MNSDPVYQRFREIAWRRRLTVAEQAELQAWLGAHPQFRAEAEREAALAAALARQPEIPVSSNFTARVMQAIDLETQRQHRSAARMTIWWRVLAPRFAAVALVATVGSVLAYRHYRTLHQEELAGAARQLAAARTLSNPVVMDDFDVIRNLSPTMAVADESLLALSDDLLELGK